MQIELLLAALGAATAAAPQPEAGEQNVVVTGIRTQDYRDRLAACLARRCPTDEDADATLALAEALFLTGEYGEARQTVRESIGRNRRRAADYPEPVSDLFRAHSRLSRHLGFDDQAARSANDILRALQAGLPQEDHRHFTARLEIADLQMTMARYPGARRQLAELAQAARRAGREDVAIIAELRALWFSYVVAPSGTAKSRLTGMARLTAPDERIRSIGARMVLARIYRAEGDAAGAEALLAEVGRSGSSARRRLIHSPAYQLSQQEVRFEQDQDIADPATYRVGTGLRSVTENYEDKWIDVGFWILPDGHVSGLEVVRQGSGTAWAGPLIDSIRGRVYSTAGEPSYRLERYTFTADYRDGTGSHIRRRSPRGRIEFLDLTTPDAPPAPAPIQASPS